MNSKRLLRVCILLCGVGFSLARAQAPQAAAQNPNTAGGTISGRITGVDASGATVTVTNNAGVARTATADSTGGFTVSNLPPGSYRVGVRLRSGVVLQERP